MDNNYCEHKPKEENCYEYGVYWAADTATPSEVQEFQILATELAKEELPQTDVVQW